MWGRREPERQAPPAWPADEPARGPRVLIEHPDPAAQDVLARGLTSRGYEVLTCGGPRAAGRTEVSCPLLRQEACEAATDADVIVSGLTLRSIPERMIVRRLARTPGRGHLVLEAGESEAIELLGSVSADDYVTSLTVDHLVAALDRVMAPSGSEPARGPTSRLAHATRPFNHGQ